MDSPSIEAGLERRDDRFNSVAQMLDCFQNRLTLDNPRLIEHCEKSELSLLIVVRIGGADVDFCARFKGGGRYLSNVQSHFWKIEPVEHDRYGLKDVRHVAVTAESTPPLKPTTTRLPRPFAMA